jgi:NAD-dependent SIR2 family protein deacetylase
VIGTSLAVWPFALLAHVVPIDIPLVLINNEDSLKDRANKLWMSGDIQDNISKICKDLNWNL